MATSSRDDFSIAIRSAFIKKGNKQKFSLLALIIASIILLSLETLNSKPLSIVRTTFKDIIYRISFMASLPSNFTGSVFNTIEGHFKIYQEYDSLKIELEKYKDEQKKISFLKTENDKLKKNIGIEEVLAHETIISKVLLDKDSPYLKSIVLNKGFNSDLKKGMPVLDGQNLIGRLTEVNYLSSRVLLINDLNSKIPVIIEPRGYHAIMSGNGKEYAYLDFLPRDKKLEVDNLVFTSGTDGIFYPGIPIGSIDWNGEQFYVKFFSDLSQLYLVSIVTRKQLVGEE